MSSPIISVIIPCYNQEEFISECVESVLAQTFKDFEIIIVNDGSQDNSLKICQHYSDKYNQITLLNQTNQGIVSARNNAIRLAKGKYIYPLDGDDKIAPDCLKKLYQVAEQNVFDVVYSQTEFFGDEKGLFVLPLPDHNNMSKANYIVCSALYKKCDWKKYEGYDEYMKDGWEDWEFWLNFIEDDKAFFRIDENLFFYRKQLKTRNQRISKKTGNKLRNYILKKHHKIYINHVEYKVSFLNKLKLFLCRPFLSKEKFDKKKRKLTQILYPRINNPKLIMTILVKNEIDIIEKQMIFHKSQGVDGFIVTDNLSDDGTRELLEEYKNKGWILEIVDEIAQDHNQAEWVNRMIMIAKNKYKAEWIINADADEFWCSKTGSLKDGIADVQNNKLFVPIYNMLSENGDAFWKNNQMIVKQFPQDVAQRLEKERKISKFSQFSVSIPKVAHRAQDYKMIHAGNHNVDMAFELPLLVSEMITIYHYNIHGVTHFKKKMIIGGAAFERNSKLGKDVGVHWRYFYEGLKDGRLDLNVEYTKSVGELCRSEISKYNLIIEDNTIKNFFEK